MQTMQDHYLNSATLILGIMFPQLLQLPHTILMFCQFWSIKYSNLSSWLFNLSKCCNSISLLHEWVLYNRARGTKAPYWCTAFTVLSHCPRHAYSLSQPHLIHWGTLQGIWYWWPRIISWGSIMHWGAHATHWLCFICIFQNSIHSKPQTESSKSNQLSGNHSLTCLA